jgi:hypothetical protein
VIKQFSPLPADPAAPLLGLFSLAMERLDVLSGKGSSLDQLLPVLLGKMGTWEAAVRLGNTEVAWDTAAEVVILLATICQNTARQKEMLDALIDQVGTGEPSEQGYTVLAGEQLL